MIQRRVQEIAMQTPTVISSTKFCWICGRAVSLENGKTDENGNIVHGMLHRTHEATGCRVEPHVAR
jgi:hypothetical protein